MGDVINFPDLENACIQIERTEAFIQTANEYEFNEYQGNEGDL